jgi:hypothetical protein
MKERKVGMNEKVEETIESRSGECFGFNFSFDCCDYEIVVGGENQELLLRVEDEEFWEKFVSLDLLVGKEGVLFGGELDSRKDVFKKVSVGSSLYRDGMVKKEGDMHLKITYEEVEKRNGCLVLFRGLDKMDIGCMNEFYRNIGMREVVMRILMDGEDGIEKDDVLLMELGKIEEGELNFIGGVY